MSILRTVPPTFERFGQGLRRPECVLGTPSGDVFVPDWPGGVAVVRGDGGHRSWLATTPEISLKPNGIALLRDGSFLIANLGDEGGIWRLEQTGRLSPWLVEVDGIALPPANYVFVDELGRTWLSVSTRRRPRQHAWRPGVADGFVVMVDERGPRIVADGLHYTNECRPDPSGTWLYVVETFGRRIVRFAIAADGGLKSRETILNLGHGSWPDGFAFDQSGAIWVTSLISNRLLRFDGGSLDIVIEEANPEHVDLVEKAFASGEMQAGHLGPIPGTELQHVTSIAFGGADLRTAYVGCLHTDCIFRFRSDYPGVAPPHWSFALP